MGIATNLWGMFTGLSTLSSFGYWCWRSIPATIEIGGHAVNLHGRSGVGYSLFVVGILLKLTDVVAHLLVPTPAAKRRPVEPGSSFRAYLARCPEPTTFGALVEPPDEGRLTEGERDATEHYEPPSVGAVN